MRPRSVVLLAAGVVLVVLVGAVLGPFAVPGGTPSPDRSTASGPDATPEPDAGSTGGRSGAERSDGAGSDGERSTAAAGGTGQSGRGGDDSGAGESDGGGTATPTGSYAVALESGSAYDRGLTLVGDGPADATLQVRRVTDGGDGTGILVDVVATDEEGRYRLDTESLDPGTYRISADGEGLARFELVDVGGGNVGGAIRDVNGAVRDNGDAARDNGDAARDVGGAARSGGGAARSGGNGAV